MRRSTRWRSWSARRRAGGGVLTQCAVEERRTCAGDERADVTYAETLSVYGTERSSSTATTRLVEGVSGVGLRLARRQGALHIRHRLGGADGPRRGLLDALSRGALLAGHPRRRLARACRTARSRASRSCSLPGGTRAVLAENLIAAMLDLEVASGNDAIASHSAIRKTRQADGAVSPGTDFISSGYSRHAARDNMFGGGNYDAEDLDEWLTIQRDWQVDAGIEPVSEEEVTRVRAAGARAVQAVFAELGLPPVTDAEVDGGDLGYDSLDMPDRDRAADVEAADARARTRRLGARRRACPRPPRFGEIAEAVVGMQRQRVSARLPADLGGDRRRRSRPLRGQRPQRLPGPGYGLPPRRRALGAAAGAAAHAGGRRPHGVDRGCRRAAPDGRRARRGGGRRRPGGGHRRRRPRVRGDDSRDDQRSCSRRCARGRLRGDSRGRWRRRGWSGCGGPPTLRSSATTERGSRARVSPSACSRRARR